MLGLCLEPRGSLLLPPPALPEPGLCAACPPCPFVPQGRRRWKAHCARGLAPALTLTLPAPCPCPQGRTSGSLSCRFLGALEGRPSSPVATSLGNVGTTLGWGPLCDHPIPPRVLSPLPPGTAYSCRKTNLWSLPEKPCLLCCLFPVPPVPCPPACI